MTRAGSHPASVVGDPSALDLLCKGAEAAGEILSSCYGLEALAKARLDLSTPTGFDRAVVLLASQLRRAAAGDERAAVAAAMGVLDVDWLDTNAAQRRRLVSESMEAAGKHLGLVPAKIEAKIGESMPDVFRAGRRDARKTTRSPKVGIKLKAVDEKAIRAIQKSAGLFVTDAMGVRVDAFGEEAREIINRGIRAGTGRAELGVQLEAAAVGKLTSRGSSYWEVVAGAYTGRGRTWSQLLGYREAGIRRYRIDSVLDRATTQICRMLHGRTFAVGDGLGILRREPSTPEAIKKQNPWGKIGKAGGKSVIYVDGTSGRVRLATIEEPGVGADDQGSFSGELNEKGLIDAGVGFPPYHGLCRSTTIPVI